MTTPICEFLEAYAESGALRLHMPGHKGVDHPLDITEIDGADSLYEASGIIRESEQNAGRLFGAQTLYSTEGSSQCIRAMLYLCALYARANNKKPLIAAGRNAHKAFLFGVALLDIDVMWLYPRSEESYLSCNIEAEELDGRLSSAKELPTAVYLTSPDYLGSTPDIEGIARVCHRHGVLLLVDNAHGAYLKFLPESRHPIDLGADMCCDSAHKTLPALTGAAYLHVSESAPALFSEQAKNALVTFGSTSPSYLILRSLDALNPYLEGYPQRLADFIVRVNACKDTLKAHGYTLWGNEPLKLTVAPKSFGYTGKELAALLLKNNIVVEFSDPDFTVMMVTPETGADGLECLTRAMLSIPKRKPICGAPPVLTQAEYVMSPREAMLSPSENLPTSHCLGRILAATSVACPPAVPIVVSGERISSEAVNAFEYYGISSCAVVKE